MSNRSSQILFALILLAAASLCKAQTTVTLAPIPQFVSYLQNGTPNALGCVFTYASGTTSPIPTYTDSTGDTQNQNPVILTAGGTANIWLAAGQSYTLTVKSYGGTKCASGNSVYTVNGIGGGASTLTTVVPFSATPSFTDLAQNQLFEFTLTGNAVALPLSVVGVTPPGLIEFQIIEDSAGGHTFSWPSNMVGGCAIGILANEVNTQQFLWNGTVATALGGCVTNNGTGPTILVGSVYATLLQGATVNATGALTVNNVPVATVICSNTTPVTVNAFSFDDQTIQTCSFPSGALNAVGKTFRLTTQVALNPAGNTGQISKVGFGLGTTSALTGAVGMDDIAQANNGPTSWSAALSVLCTVTTAGSSGTLTCAALSANSAVGAAAGLFDTGPGGAGVNLTGVVYVGSTCRFTDQSTSNTCTGNILTIEQLN